METETYANVFEPKGEWEVEVANSKIAVDRYQTPEVLVDTTVNVAVSEEDIETPFADVTAKHGVAVTCTRRYDEDGSLVQSTIST
jgi:hypothetical protein